MAVPEMVPVSDARSELADMLDGCAAGQVFFITRQGKPVAVLVGMEEYARLEEARDAGG